MLKIALIADGLTTASLAPEAACFPITPQNYRQTLRDEPCDVLFVESAWFGHEQSWRGKIASYPRYPWRSNRALVQVVREAKSRGIPTLFWNREDDVHFGRFINSARHFDHVLTVDANSIPRYRERMGGQASIGSMMFAVQPQLHAPSGRAPSRMALNFLGSYSTHIHPGRRDRQHMLFAAAEAAGIPLDIYDRNANRPAACYRFPATGGQRILPAVPYAATADIYRDYLASLNVNTVEHSPTMLSRRLLEILGCGGLAITTPALAVTQHFAPYCHVVSELQEATELFARLKRDGRSAADETMARDGADYVHTHHRWAQRVAQIAQIIQSPR